MSLHSHETEQRGPHLHCQHAASVFSSSIMSFIVFSCIGIIHVRSAFARSPAAIIPVVPKDFLMTFFFCLLGIFQAVAIHGTNSCFMTAGILALVVRACESKVSTLVLHV